MVFDQLEQNVGSTSVTNADMSSSSSFGLASGGLDISEGNKSESIFNSNASFKKEKPNKDKTNPGPGYVVISGDYDGEIKVFLNALRPKHSSLP
jgi:hypothetical protein